MRMILGKAMVASAVLVASAVGAQAAATVKVPFSFSVNGKQCPAGSYVVSSDSDHNQVMLREIGGKRSFVWVTDPADAPLNSKQASLKFDVAGTDHSLRSVQYGRDVTPRLDKKDKGEHQQVESVPSE